MFRVCVCVCVCLFVCLKQEKFLPLVQRLVTQSFPGTNEWKEHFGMEQKRATEGERWAAITDSGNATVYFLVSDCDLELISTCEKCSNTFKTVGLNLHFWVSWQTLPICVLISQSPAVFKGFSSFLCFASSKPCSPLVLKMCEWTKQLELNDSVSISCYCKECFLHFHIEFIEKEPILI